MKTFRHPDGTPVRVFEANGKKTVLLRELRLAGIDQSEALVEGYYVFVDDEAKPREISPTGRWIGEGPNMQQISRSSPEGQQMRATFAELYLGQWPTPEKKTLRERVKEALENATHNRMDGEEAQRADPTDPQYGSLLQVAIHMVDHCSDLGGEDVNAVMREVASLRGELFGGRYARKL